MKRIVLVVLMVGAMVGASAQKETSAERRDQLFEQAMDLYQKQKYAAAQQIFDQIARSNRGRADLATDDACYFAAVCSEKLDNNDARYRLEEFMRLYPQSSRCNMARFYLGNFHYTRGEYHRALDYYRQVEAKEVEYNHRAEYNFKMGYCYFQQGDLQHATDLFVQQITGHSKYRNSSLYYYAHIQYMNGQYESALKNFKELQSDRKFAKMVPSYVARIYFYLGREDELLEMAPALLRDKDTFRKNEIHQMVGEIYFNRGEYADAVHHYRMVNEEVNREYTQSCTPQDNDYQIGYSYYQLGKYDSAAMYLQRKTVCSDSVTQNALYILGYCYVRLDRKRDAASMMRQAAAFDFNKKIQEDALFNYAKLSCELNQNAYSESIRSFEDYLKKYPDSRNKTEVQEILTDLYCSTNNYKEAIRMLEQVPERNAKLDEAYQRALLNRGIELFNSGKADQGAELYAQAVKVNAVPRITADANYLLAESYYRKGQYEQAERNLNRFLLSSYSKSSAYANDARYTYAYILMRNKRYDEALSTFGELERRLNGRTGAKSLAMANDVRNRLGDCYYVQSRFDDAIAMYSRVIDGGGTDADYATYQKALAFGAQGRNSEKLTYLNYIFERFENSSLCSKAMLEIANTYLMCDNNEMAMTYYSNFIRQYPHSAFVKTALLNQGLIYYNTEREDDALATFDRLLTQYPGTDEARDALSTVKNIYIAQNRVGDYFDYVKRTTKITVSAVEQDSTTFLAAEERYQEGDYSNAAVALEGYLTRFPSGLFAAKAHYLLADSYMRLDRDDQALPHFEAIVRAPANQYTERSHVQAAAIAYKLGNYRQAAPLYEYLCAQSENDESRLQGQMGALRCAVALQQPQAIYAAGRRLIAESKASVEMREEAHLAMARTSFDGQLYDTAFSHYAALAGSSNGEYSGEARCRQAEVLMLRQQYDQAESIIEHFVTDASSDYWLAYSFILWADIYSARGNNLQAKQTLQSIIENYDGGDLVTIASQKLEAIKAAEQQPASTVEPEEMTIEL